MPNTAAGVFFKKFGFVFSLLFTFVIIAVFHFTRLDGLKLYPVVTNFMIFWLFFSSLFANETIIQKFARIMDGELNKPALRYTKNLTYIWCIYLFLQFLCTCATCFMSDKIWMLYNGCISYILLGVFFAIEYPIRIIFKKRNAQGNK